jgi:hypothetical protein
MLAIHRTSATLFGRSAAGAPANNRPAHHQRRQTWRVEYLEERTLLSNFSVTNINDDGSGSLRQAIIDSNGTTGPNEIDFAVGLSGTITLTRELMIQNNAVSIVGPGQNTLSVSGNGNSRVFEVASGISVSLTGMTITGGMSSDGGGVSNAGTLTLSNCTLSRNASPNSIGPFGGRGGGILNTGTLTLTDCTHVS